MQKNLTTLSEVSNQVEALNRDCHDALVDVLQRHADVDDAEQVTLSFAEGAPPTAGSEGEEYVEVRPA